ncbi:hypothetical protein D9M69_728240 [compost metagenome]
MLRAAFSLQNTHQGLRRFFRGITPAQLFRRYQRQTPVGRFNHRIFCPHPYAESAGQGDLIIPVQRMDHRKAPFLAGEQVFI